MEILCGLALSVEKLSELIFARSFWELRRLSIFESCPSLRGYSGTPPPGGWSISDIPTANGNSVANLKQIKITV